ncbi:uncharacterized protein [Rutidosis leptorrhynchoides]|uniref:uncharacterized protein n=1 Tax=Rutidosis leptorrhynchoides TaxID=125765 RepID=UPI003A99815C
MPKLELHRLKTLWGNYSFDYAISISRGFSGGLISIWDPNSFVKSSLWCHANYIIEKGKWIMSGLECYMINVYAPQNFNDKSILWGRLLDFMNSNPGCYIVFGDFNSVRHEDERFGSEYFPHDASIFNNFIEDAGLIDLPLCGRNFTWMNKFDTKMSRLDRIFITQHVADVHSDLKLKPLCRRWSDHLPLLLVEDHADYGPIPFKYFNSWTHRETFTDFITCEWNQMEAVLQFHSKLKLLKSKLKIWIIEKRTVESHRKYITQQKLDEIEFRMDNGTVSEDDRSERTNLFKELESLQIIEESDFFQKSRIKWDMEGDKNSKFFHRILKKKRFKHAIQGIFIDGIWVSNLTFVKKAFFDYFKLKFEHTSAFRSISSQ